MAAASGNLSEEAARGMESWLYRLIATYPDLEVCEPDIRRGFHLLLETFQAGRRLLVVGNGGSAADADHIVGELVKGCTLARPVPASFAAQLRDAEHGAYLASRLQRGLPVLSLSGPAALLTAIANDTAADMIFAQQVYGLGQAGDLLWALSTSGNSLNVIHALEVARALGLRTLGLTGAHGGAMARYCDVCIRVPHTDTQAVQERHLPIYHALCIALEQTLFHD
jgi:D-sedoheptulose 7-phosphate isomerase